MTATVIRNNMPTANPTFFIFFLFMEMLKNPVDADASSDVASSNIAVNAKRKLKASNISKNGI